ncbi:MAG: hypothetical protein M3Y72_18235 [Acidobacteriota bacterium]|nr:hypothetical protein [Acidobacteriota bacterium]
MRERPFVAFTRNFALLFLAVAVFSWGLNAKLELYKPVSTQRAGLVKLSAEKHSAKVLKALEQQGAKQLPPTTLKPALVFSLLLAVLIRESLAHRAEIALSSPSRFYLQGFSSRNRPPPALQ